MKFAEIVAEMKDRAFSKIWNGCNYNNDFPQQVL